MPPTTLNTRVDDLADGLWENLGRGLVGLSAGTDLDSSLRLLEDVRAASTLASLSGVAAIAQAGAALARARAGADESTLDELNAELDRLRLAAESRVPIDAAEIPPESPEPTGIEPARREPSGVPGPEKRGSAGDRALLVEVDGSRGLVGLDDLGSAFGAGDETPTGGGMTLSFTQQAGGGSIRVDRVLGVRRVRWESAASDQDGAPRTGSDPIGAVYPRLDAVRPPAQSSDAPAKELP